MTSKHEHKTIPSPFKCVNQYEKEFVKVFNKNLSNTMSDVLKYIAKNTADAIKEIQK